jgi:hypothetical protein
MGCLSQEARLTAELGVLQAHMARLDSEKRSCQEADEALKVRRYGNSDILQISRGREGKRKTYLSKNTTRCTSRSQIYISYAVVTGALSHCVTDELT